MPNYLLEHSKIKLPRDQDARVHITDDDKARIKELHEANIPQREIARRFIGIASRRMIQFILFPERRIANVKIRTERLKQNGQKYYDKETHRVNIARWRKKKSEYLDKIGATQYYHEAKKHNLPVDFTPFMQK